jgi:hypothetical protein
MGCTQIAGDLPGLSFGWWFLTAQRGRPDGRPHTPAKGLLLPSAAYPTRLRDSRSGQSESAARQEPRRRPQRLAGVKDRIADGPLAANWSNVRGDHGRLT